MKLLMSDISLDFIHSTDDMQYVDLTKRNISNCIGCFGCWVKTPGRCVIRDDAVRIYPLIAQSEKVIYVTQIKYGSYDTIMKTMLERAIPIQQAFIRLYHSETHHVQRDVKEKDALIIAYGESTPQEQQLFTRLVQRNSYNMLFRSYHILFICRSDLENTVKREVKKWNISW